MLQPGTGKSSVPLREHDPDLIISVVGILSASEVNCEPSFLLVISPDQTMLIRAGYKTLGTGRVNVCRRRALKLQGLGFGPCLFFRYHPSKNNTNFSTSPKQRVHQTHQISEGLMNENRPPHGKSLTDRATPIAPIAATDTYKRPLICTPLSACGPPIYYGMSIACRRIKPSRRPSQDPSAICCTRLHVPKH